MNNISVQNIIDFFAVCIIVFTFFKWIISFGNPIVELKKRVDAHDKLFANDKSHLEKIDKGVSQIDEGMSVMGQALSEMMKHEITGNDIQALKDQQKKVNDYFFNRGNIHED